MNRWFCTYFDHRYLSRGIAMYRSLKEQSPEARLWVLCLSDECYHAIAALGWADLIPIHLDDFERGDDKLIAAKADRSRIEYYFTCTPSLIRYIFNHHASADLVTYVDADLYFYSSVEPLFDEMDSHPVAIIAHRFAPQHRWMEQNGVFNVGWLTFRRDADGLACLEWWRERCIEWCHDYIDGDRFADQKYLDRFPKLFPKVKIIEHKGANVAAWNLANYRLGEHDGKLWVDDQPLIFFHFHGLRKVAPGVVDPSLAYYGLRLSGLLERRVFRPYIQKLREAHVLVAPALQSSAVLAGLERKAKQPTKRWVDAGKMISAYVGVLTRRTLLSRGE